MEDLMFFECKLCGNMVEMLRDSGMPMECCNEQMVEIIPRESESVTGSEKHIPDVKVSSGKVEVKIGSEPHPMTSEHHIEWVILQTDKSIIRRNLTPQDPPSVTFCYESSEHPLAVYEYCNIHGLWKKSLSEKAVSGVTEVVDHEVSSYY